MSAARRSVQEAYLAATRTSNLKLVYDAACDADKLLAAGYVGQGDERKSLALDVVRVLATTNMVGIHATSDRLGAMLTEKFEGLERVTAVDISKMLLKLLASPKCKSCGGVKHPTFAGTPMLDESRACPDCRGTGDIPLERLFRTEHVQFARWLRSELGAMRAMVFKEMRMKSR